MTGVLESPAQAERREFAADAGGESPSGVSMDETSPYAARRINASETRLKGARRTAGARLRRPPLPFDEHPKPGQIAAGEPHLGSSNAP
jgi:hypothetical protein